VFRSVDKPPLDGVENTLPFLSSKLLILLFLAFASNALGEGGLPLGRVGRRVGLLPGLTFRIHPRAEAIFAEVGFL